MTIYAIDSLVDQNETNVKKVEMNVKKAIQRIAVASLSRGGFFKKAAFHGGTSLMMFHGLQRFSEDLDFMLTVPESDFRIDRYFSYLADDFESFGLDVEIESYKKKSTSDIDTAHIRGNTRELVLSFYSDSLSKKYPSTMNTSVKFEIDINPPDYAEHEIISEMCPYLHSITLCDLPTLFAGKIGAVLTRQWKNRVKGRDLFDFEFYINNDVPFNQRFLASGLKRAGIISDINELNLGLLIQLLNERFDNLDYESAKYDAIDFVYNMHLLDSWSSDHFKNLTRSIIEKGINSIDPEPMIRKRCPSYLID